MASLIEDYALLGNCKGSALVSKNGSMDWLCLPRFDSAACFAALLGNEEHGSWRISPKHAVSNVKRRYIDGTLVLETVMECEGGTICITDFMCPQSLGSDLFRIVKGIQGSVSVISDLIIRFDYGSILPWVQRHDRGIRATAGPESLYVRSNARQEITAHKVTAEFTVEKDQTVAFQLTWTESNATAPSDDNPEGALQSTIAWWKDWSNRCKYQGLWKGEVVQSLTTLKGLTYAPTGGIVAAPTTSLPEHIGGARNWDYRYCWIRDATFTLYSFLIGGYIEEAIAWRSWLVNAAAGDPHQLQIMYGVAGERRLTEMQLDWLPGYEGSLPVRTGNAAYSQHQLDVPGEIMECLHLARRYGMGPNEDAWRVQLSVLDFLISKWEQPDEGIWEIRGPRRHFTHSKVMAWVAADRAVKDVEHFGLQGDVERWRKLRDQIHREVCVKGFNTELNAFVQSYGSKETDASLLMLPLVGFIEPDDPRMKGTLKLIEERLVKDGLVKRYLTDSNVDGLDGKEGRFLLCSFWLADNYAIGGRRKEAKELFEMLLSLRNDVGLLSEEYSLPDRRMLGNFPQAFSHVGLVNTARNLSRDGGPAIERGHEE